MRGSPFYDFFTKNICFIWWLSLCYTFSPVWHEKCKQILQQQVLLNKVKNPKSTKIICLCISVPWTEFAVLAMFTKQKLVLPLFPQWRGHIAMVAWHRPRWIPWKVFFRTKGFCVHKYSEGEYSGHFDIHFHNLFRCASIS